MWFWGRDINLKNCSEVRESVHEYPNSPIRRRAQQLNQQNLKKSVIIQSSVDTN